MTQTTEALTRRTAGVRIWTADHYTGSRISRRGWQASIVPREAMQRAGGSVVEDVQQWCTHSHKSIAAAKACGTAMWKRLP